MSFSKGSIGLVSSSQSLKMPTSVNEIPRFLPPVLHLIYNCSQIIKSTKEHLENISGIVSLGQEEKYFPPTFIHNRNKKRTITVIHALIFTIIMIILDIHYLNTLL